MKKIVVPVVVGIVLVCIALAIYLKPSQTVTRAMPPEKSALSTPSNAIATRGGDAAIQEQLAKLGGVGASDLALQFASATNYKQFVDERAANPSAGSYFFAVRSLDVCSAALFANQMAQSPRQEKSAERTEPITATEPSKSPAAAARMKLSKLCEGVRIVPEELTEIVVVADGSKMGDRFFSASGPEPLFVMRAAKSEPKNLDALIALARDARNPYMVSSALEVLGLPHLMPKLTVAGEVVATLLPEQQAAMRTAFQLLRCDFGANCGADSPEVLFDCAMSRSCKARSLDDALRTDFLRPGSRNDWSQVEAYRLRFADAIKKGDTWIVVNR